MPCTSHKRPGPMIRCLDGSGRDWDCYGLSGRLSCGPDPDRDRESVTLSDCHSESRTDRGPGRDSEPEARATGLRTVT
jgi:hypothetical protein